MTIGEMVKSMLVKLEWFDTRFPRIPVNVQVIYLYEYRSDVRQSYCCDMTTQVLEYSSYLTFLYVETNQRCT